MKKNVLISFVTDAETDLQAIFALNRIMEKLPESDLEKFEAFEVLDAVQ
jgi:hypothetical protein